MLSSLVLEKPCIEDGDWLKESSCNWDTKVEGKFITLWQPSAMRFALVHQRRPPVYIPLFRTTGSTQDSGQSVDLTTIVDQSYKYRVTVAFRQHPTCTSVHSALFTVLKAVG